MRLLATTLLMPGSLALCLLVFLHCFALLAGILFTVFRCCLGPLYGPRGHFLRYFGFPVGHSPRSARQRWRQRATQKPQSVSWELSFSLRFLFPKIPEYDSSNFTCSLEHARPSKYKSTPASRVSLRPGADKSKPSLERQKRPLEVAVLRGGEGEQEG